MIIDLPDSEGIQDVLIDLRQWEGRERWYSGPVVERLRFDPLNRHGDVYLSEVALLRYRRKGGGQDDRYDARSGH